MVAADFIPVLVGPFAGSFLLATALRYPGWEGIVLGRSACPACRTQIPARDLMPILSWFLLRGRCRHCAAPVGWLYPAIEVAAAALALWAATLISGWLLWASCALGWALLCLSLIDIRCHRLPDFLTLPTLLAGLGVAGWASPDALADHILGAALGYAVPAALGRLYYVLRGREGLGLGDAKLLAAGGAWVSWEALPGTVLMAAAVALFLVVVMHLFRRIPVSATTRVPFGPYLAAAIWLSWLYGPVALTW